MNPPVVLTVAGTDSGGAAGIAADLSTFAALGAHGGCVVTAVTAQDTTGVREIHRVPLGTIAAQLEAVLDDLPVAVVKTGMLGSADVVGLVARRCAHLRIVVDPVLVATSGALLGDDDVVAAYRHQLLPVATLATPNLDEARALTGHHGPPAALAEELARSSGAAVVVTGGPEGRADEDDSCTDSLAGPGSIATPIVHPAVRTANDHGTGCTFSAALAAHLAHGVPLADAVREAAAFTTTQLQRSSTWTLGRGRGPVAHTTTPTTGGSA